MAVTPVRNREGVFDVVVWTIDTPDAPRRRVTRRVEGQRNAEKVERDLLHDRDQGKSLDAVPTLATFASTYFDSRKHEVSAKTMFGYRTTFERYVVPALGRRRLTAVSRTAVAKLYADLFERGLSLGTVRAVHRVLSMVMQAAFEDDLVRRNPCHKAKLRSGSVEPNERGLEPDACRRLLAEIEGTPVYAPAALAALTGLRRGEVLALLWEDVDLAGAELHVSAALEQVRGAVRRQQPKTPRSRRVVPLSPGAVSILRRHKAAQDALRLRWGVFWSDLGFVFPADSVTQSRDGGRLWTPDAFQQAFRRAQFRAQERRLAEHVAAGGSVEEFEPTIVGFHDLRHTAATTWLRSGVRVEVVSRWLGHANSTITLATYSHVTTEERHEGVEAVDSLV